jgi:hypothetical protein
LTFTIVISIECHSDWISTMSLGSTRMPGNYQGY